jgi:hypothetical protein
MASIRLKALECKHDQTPQCPSSEVRLRMAFEEMAPGKESALFDPATELSRLNTICENCEKFEPKGE